MDMHADFYIDFVCIKGIMVYSVGKFSNQVSRFPARLLLLIEWKNDHKKSL